MTEQPKANTEAEGENEEEGAAGDEVEDGEADAEDSDGESEEEEEGGCCSCCNKASSPIFISIISLKLSASDRFVHTLLLFGCYLCLHRCGQKRCLQSSIYPLWIFYRVSYSNLISSNIQFRKKAVWISWISGDEGKEGSGGARAWREGRERKEAVKCVRSGFCCNKNIPEKFVVANIGAKKLYVFAVG